MQKTETPIRKRVAVIGIGNITAGDDGFGVRAIERVLESDLAPEGAEFFDGGTGGLKLMRFFEEYEKLVFIDIAEMKAAPGELRRIALDEINLVYEVKIISLHSLALPHVIEMAKLTLKERFPEVVIIAAQPSGLRAGMELSPQLAAALPRACELAINEL